MIVITRAVRTGSMCPSQWQVWGTNGKEYYIRYRWGILTIQKGDPGGEEVLRKLTGKGEYDGSMTFQELREMVAEMMVLNCDEVERDPAGGV